MTGPRPKRWSDQNYASAGALILLGFVVVMPLLSGCARVQLPAFDPTGSRIFAPGTKTSLLTPSGGKGLFGHHRKNQPAPVVGSFQPPPFSPAPFSTAPLPAGPTPVPAQPPKPFHSDGPAFQHPPDPPPCDGSKPSGLFHHASFTNQKHLIPKPTGPKTAGQKGELVMTPSRIIAPVGSEVVVLAGICGPDGYFVKNQPLEWMLSNDSVGQIIEVGGMQHAAFNAIVPPTSEKKSGQYAHGRTGLKNLVLTRGTPTTCDDIELKEGQTFISVSSASPGTSYITGYAPKAEGWDRRLANTVIHWVDGQWSIPAPASATAGTVHPLTTVIHRTGDLGGMEGWLVRYSILGGAPAEFAPAGSQTAEAISDKDGLATVQIRQIAGQFEPGTTQVRVDVVRPAMFGQPELVVERGLTTVTWSAPALTIRSIGPRTAGLNEPFNYRIEVTNPGDQLARDVVVRTRTLDESIQFISANPKPTEFGRQLEWKLGDIPPGAQVRVIDVQFKSDKRGNMGLCFEVASDSDRLRTEACSETEIALPCIGFDIEGPTFARVGEELKFRLNVVNQCNEPLENVRMTIRLDQGLINPGYSNPVTFELERLQSNESRNLPLTILTQAPGTRCFEIEIAAREGHTASARRCIEVSEQAIEPPRDQLSLQLQGGAPMQVGGRSLVIANITNRGNTPMDNVTVNTRFPDSVRVVQLSQGLTVLRDLADELVVGLGRLNPQETRQVGFEYEGLNVVAGAPVEITVTSPLGAVATDKINLQVDPIVPGNGGNGRPIGIPDDPTSRPDPNAESISIQFRATATQIGVHNPSMQHPSLPTRADIEVVVKNTSGRLLRDVGIKVFAPPGIMLEDLQPIALVENRNDPITELYFRRINEMRIGEEIRFVATVSGVEPRDVHFGIQVESPDIRTTAQSVIIRVVP